MPSEFMSYLQEQQEKSPFLTWLEEQKKEEKRQKGLGYFGKLKRPDGYVSTELSIGVTGKEFGWKETEIPSLVPTLTRDEIDSLLAGGDMSPEIVEKAKKHALMRIKKGLNPFAQTGEQRPLKEESPFLRYIASQQELKEAQKELLAKAQETVKYKVTPEEIKTRGQEVKKEIGLWSSETWSALGEQVKEAGANEIFTKDFWTETGKTLITQAAEMMLPDFQQQQVQQLVRYSKLKGAIQRFEKDEAGVEEVLATFGQGQAEVTPSVKESLLYTPKTAAEFVLFIPKTAFSLAEDPIETIRTNPLGVLGLVAVSAGVGRAGRIKAKAAKQKGWLMTGDYINPLVESKMVSKQLKARLLEIPSDIEFEIGDVPIEIIKYKQGGKMPFLKHHWEGIKTDIKNAGDLPDRPLKYGTKERPWLGLRIPLRTFEQYPWLKRVLYDEWRTGEAGALAESAILKNELRAWRKKLPRKSQERVGVYADYMQEGGKEIMQHMMKVAKDKGRNWKKFEFPELTPAELEYYNYGQKVFSDFLPRLNQIRVLAGQKPIGKVRNYSTWIRNLSELESLGIDIAKASAEQIEFHLNSLPLSFAKHRAGEILRAGVELDYGLLLENYSRQATRNIHISPSIIKSRTLLEPFRLTDGKKITWDMYKETPRLATWLEQWTDRIAGQGRALPKGKAGKIIKTMNALNRNIAIAILSYNVRSAIIQPTAFKNSYVYLGRKYLAEGFMQNLSKEKRVFADANSLHLAARKAGMFDVTVAMTKEVPVGRKLGRAKQMFGQVGMFPLQWLDYQTARATWLGAYEMAIKKYGWKHKRAVTWADDVIVKTQASAQVGDIAPIQGTAMGRFMTLFQTFVINDYDMLTHDVFGYKNPYMNMAQRQRNIGRYVLSTAVVNAMYEGVLKIRSPYPAPIWSIKRSIEEGDSFVQAAFGVGMEMAEVYPIWGGTARWSSPHRIAYPAFMQKAIVDPFQMLKRLEAKPSITKDQAEWAATVLGIGGASQFFKYLRRRKRGQTMTEAVLGVRAETRGKKKQPSW